VKSKSNQKPIITLTADAVLLTLTVPLSFEAFEEITCSLGTSGEVRNPLLRLERLQKELSHKLSQEIEPAICKMLKIACIRGQKYFNSQKKR